MIVQIFITQSNCIQPLPDQTAHIMIATRLTAWIRQRMRDRVTQAQ